MPFFKQTASAMGLFVFLGLMWMLGMTYSPSLLFKPDFAAISSLEARQAAFIAFMVPKVTAANQQVLFTRQRILDILIAWQTSHSLSSADRFWLRSTAYVYQIPSFSIHRPADIQALLLRVDEVPPSLVVAQAANESAWGTSRFAIEGDNFFGQYCYVSGCGVLPLDRPAGQTYEVQRFDSVQDSINDYIYNLNTNPSYAAFRSLRATARQEGDLPMGSKLVPGLRHYSVLGQDYVTRITSIIINHHLMQYDHIDPAPFF